MGFIITERKFFNQLANGDDFTLNTGVYDTYYKYNAAELSKVVYTFRISWTASASVSDSFDIVSGIITREVGSFIDDGFIAGDTIDVFNAGSVLHSDEVITAVTDSQIVLVDNTINVSSSETMELKGKTPLTGFKFNYNLINNADVFTPDNLQSGATMGWSADSVGAGGPRSTAFVDGDYIGSPKTGETGSFKIKYVQDIDAYNQEFQFEHIFRNFPFYLPDESGTFETSNINLLSGTNSFKYAFDLRAGGASSQNPNEFKGLIEDGHFGNSGGFDETFNGNGANFALESIALTDNVSGATVSDIDILNDTDVQIEINSPTSVNLDAAHPIVLYFCKLPEESDVVDTENFNTNWVFDYVYTTRGAGAASGTVLKNVLLTTGSPASDQLVLNFTTQFATNEAAQFTEGNNYLIAVAVGDVNNPLTVRTTIKAKFSQIIKSADVSGLFETEDFGYYRHDMEEGVDTPFTSYSGWIEDAALLEYRFNLDIALTPLLEKFRVKLVAYDTTDDTYFEIRSQEWNFSNAPLSGLQQQLYLNESAGFNLPATDQFNLISLDLDGTIGTKQTYKLLYPFRLNYENYLKLADVDGVFFDNTLLNNGLNKKISRYDGVSSYEIRHIIEADVLDENGVSTTYIELFPYMEVQNYEDDDGVNLFSAFDLQVMTLGGTQLPDNKISKNQDNLIRATFTFTTPVSPSLDYHGIIRLEEFQAGGIKAIEEASTIYDVPAGQILQPKSGETKTTIVNDGSTLVLECIIPETQAANLPDGSSFSISARTMGDFSAIVGAKTMESGAVKTTESSLTKTIE